jgi:hypothetical protein
VAEVALAFAPDIEVPDVVAEAALPFEEAEVEAEAAVLGQVAEVGRVTEAAAHRPLANLIVSMVVHERTSDKRRVQLSYCRCRLAGISC